MKSPFTGSDMTLQKEMRSIVFRKQSFEVVYHFYRCGDTGEQLTNDALDTINMDQVYNQYRDIHNIPFPYEIIDIRKMYDLSAKKMSEILGFGVNSYRQYESGEMPNVSNAKLIQLARDPKQFMNLIRLCDTVNHEDKLKYIERVESILSIKRQNKFERNVKEYLMGNHLPDVFSGYRASDFDKFAEMIVFFCQKVQPFKTKMNKLLFYADFLMYKLFAHSISGVKYRAIDLGPVPDKYQSIFEYLSNENEILIETIEFAPGVTGEQFKMVKDREHRKELFSEKELDVLETIAQKFKTTSTNRIIEVSHEEAAWKENKDNRRIINYNYAFDLLHV